MLAIRSQPYIHHNIKKLMIQKERVYDRMQKGEVLPVNIKELLGLIERPISNNAYTPICWG